jgi:septum formation protein
MAKLLPFRLILASGSPARRDLLRKAGYPFEVMPANIDEPTGAGFQDARTLVAHIAWLKAAAIAPRIDADAARPAVVLSADTVGWLAGEVIGKPDNEVHARDILERLMGSEHELWTGVCLWLRPGDVQIAWQEMSRVVMARLPEGELGGYLASGVWRGCSGAYAIQEEGDDPLVQIREGSKSNVIGLPMETLERALSWLAAGSSPVSSMMAYDIPNRLVQGEEFTEHHESGPVE